MTTHQSAGRRAGHAEAAKGKNQRPVTGAPRSPSEVLALQRTLGNGVVSRLLDEEQPAPVQRSSVQEVLGSSGMPLAASVRAEMEARLGADFSDVRLHTGASAQRSAAEIGARAYTSGSHVVIGDGGADKHTLAHELTHVIQQRQGPVAGTDNGDGLSISDPSDRFEREAEANAARVLSSPVSAAVNGPDKETGARPAASGGSIQRVAADAAFGHSTAYGEREWMDSAQAFEKRLGAYAFNHPRARNAALETAKKMKEVLLKYVEEDLEMDPFEEERAVNNSFFNNDRTSAGQVGERHVADLEKFFLSSNLRELMTAIYNAAYYNTGKRTTKKKVSLKAVMHDVISGDLDPERLGMNKVEIDKHVNFLKKSWTRPLFEQVARAQSGITGGPDLSYNYALDPYALGNIMLQSESEGFFGDTREMVESQRPRLTRSPSDLSRNRKTQDYYKGSGAELGSREKMLLNYEPDGYYQNLGPRSPLSWIEGSARYKIDEKSSWAETAVKRGMPTVAGMSGTTTRMLKTFQWLNVGNVDIFDFRMALMGWMLPSQDHSLYEILRGSWAAGVRGPHESMAFASKGAAVMYQNIAPFSEEELRERVCLGGEFPHEANYGEKAKTHKLLEPSDKSYHSVDPGDPGVAKQYDDFQIKPENTQIVTNFKLPHAVALRVYSGGLHELINLVLSSRVIPGLGESALLMMIKSKLKGYVKNPEPPVDLTEYDPDIAANWAAAHQSHDQTAKAEALALIDARIDGIAPRVLGEVTRHADMVVEALSRLPGHTGKVYRGDWSGTLSWTYGGGVISSKSLSSASIDERVALGFMSRPSNVGLGRHPVLLELTLGGQAGRKISDFSEYGDLVQPPKIPEKEVLIEPNTDFRVERREWVSDNRVPGGRYEKIVAEEITA